MFDFSVFLYQKYTNGRSYEFRFTLNGVNSLQK